MTLLLNTLTRVSNIWAQDFGTWTLTDSLLSPRQDAASVQLADGNILVSGGTNLKRSAEIFDYKAGKWHEVDSMIVGREYHKLIRLLNNNILTIGGFNTKSSEIYNITAKTWSLTDSMHYQRSWGETATLLDNGEVLVAGGHLEATGVSKNLRSCERYNPQTGLWTVTDSLKINRWGHTATKLMDGRVLVTGGAAGEPFKVGTTLKDCELFDPETGSGSTQHCPDSTFSRFIIKWKCPCNGWRIYK